MVLPKRLTFSAADVPLPFPPPPLREIKEEEGESTGLEKADPLMGGRALKLKAVGERISSSSTIWSLYSMNRTLPL